MLVVIPILTNIASNWLDKFFGESAALTVALAGVVAAGIVAAGYYISTRERQEALAGEFGLFARSEDLKPEDFGFERLAPRTDPIDITRRPLVDGVYIPRQAIAYEDRASPNGARTFDERELLSILEEGRSFLVIGQPTEGKSRLLFELAKKMKGYLIVQPGLTPLSRQALEMLRGQNVLCVFDDINASVERGVDLASFYQAVSSVARNHPIAAACRDGNELSALELGNATSPLQRLYEGFHHRFVLRPPTQGEIDALRTLLNDNSDGAAFSIGDVCMRRAFDLMRQRFDVMSQESRECLWSLHLLSAVDSRLVSHDRLGWLLKDLHGQGGTLRDLRSCLHDLSRNAFIASAADADEIVPRAAFVGGRRTGRFYQPGRTLEGDMPRLESSLLKHDDSAGLKILGFAYFTDGKIDEAKRLWGQIVERYGNATDAEQLISAVGSSYSLAVCYHAHHELRLAFDQYRLTVDRFGTVELPKARMYVAESMAGCSQILHATGKTSESMAAAQEIQKRFASLQDPLLNGALARAALQLAWIHFDKRELHQTLNEAREVIATYGSCPEADIKAALVYAKVLIADVMIERSLLAEAGRELRNVIDEFSQDGDLAIRHNIFDARRKLAVVGGSQGHIKEALTLLDSAIKEVPGGNQRMFARSIVEARLSAAGYCIEEEQFPSAEEHLQKAASLICEIPDGHLSLEVRIELMRASLISLTVGPDAALAALEILRQRCLEQDHPDAILFAGKSLCLSANALIRGRRYAEVPPLRTRFDELCAAGPVGQMAQMRAEFEFNVQVALQFLDRNDEAQAAAKGLRRWTEGKDELAIHHFRAASSYFLGLHQCEHGDADAGCRTLQQNVNEYGDHPASALQVQVGLSMNALADYAQRQGRLQDALEICRNVESKFAAKLPQFDFIRAEALFIATDVLTDQGRPDEAATALEALIEEFQSSGDARVEANLAHAGINLGLLMWDTEGSKAETHFQQVSERFRSHASPGLRRSAARASHLTGRLYAEKRSAHSEAIEQYQKTLQMIREDSDSKVRQYAVAVLLSLAGSQEMLDCDSAMKTLELADSEVALDPSPGAAVDAALTWCNLGLLLSEAGQPADALAHYQRVVERFKGHDDSEVQSLVATALFQTSLIFNQLGDADAADGARRLLLELFASNGDEDVQGYVAAARRMAQRCNIPP